MSTSFSDKSPINATSKEERFVTTVVYNRQYIISTAIFCYKELHVKCGKCQKWACETTPYIQLSYGSSVLLEVCLSHLLSHKILTR